MKRLLPLVTCLLMLTCCKPSPDCHVSIGDARFSLDPNSASFPGLNSVWGYEYFTGGHRGVVVIRTSLTEFVAFERTCPCDDSSKVSVSKDWGSQILQCPTCGTLFSVNNFGFPMDGAATSCPLYQYSTSYSNGTLSVY